LEKLHLCSSPNLTDTTVNTILKSCKELMHLNLNMCGQLDPRTLREYQANFPQVKILQNSRLPSDPRDDGLRVWLPVVGAKKPDDKKKKKK